MNVQSAAYLWALIALMGLINYLLRMLPATVISKVKFGRYMKRVLFLIPYTALTALVFPGIFFSVGDHVLVATAGTLVAILTALLRMSLSLTVVISVLSVIAMLMCL